MAKYSWKKPPEIRDEKCHLALNAAELLPNMRDNHQLMCVNFIQLLSLFASLYLLKYLEQLRCRVPAADRHGLIGWCTDDVAETAFGAE